MIELIDKSIKVVIMTIFHTFMTLEDGLSMLNRDRVENRHWRDQQTEEGKTEGTSL